MKPTSSLLLLLSLTTQACTRETPPAAPPPDPVAAAQEAAPTPVAITRHGAPIGEAPAADLVAVLETPESFQDKALLLTGHVRAVCQNKGCWMELAAAADPKAPGCRVRFKDYGFFVPRDASGKLARVEAQVQVKTVSRKMVEHWESEGGTFARKNPDGTATEVQLIATGVELVPPAGRP